MSSWSQDPAYGSYSNYGDYNEGQYGADSASYDMFDDGGADAQQQYQQPHYPSESGFGSGASSAFQPSMSSHQQHQGQAYQRGYTYFLF